MISASRASRLRPHEHFAPEGLGDGVAGWAGVRSLPGVESGEKARAGLDLGVFGAGGVGC